MVLILGYNAKNNIDDCFLNLLIQDYNNYTVWFADNNSNDGAAEDIEKKYSKVRVLKFDKNYGYTGGNNRLMEMAFKDGADFCLVLNSDTKIKKDLISSLVNTFEAKNKTGVKIGLVQPMIMLYDRPKLINSAGNVIHYLGFGYCGSYLASNVPKEDKEIVSVSGAAMLISRDYFEDVGKLDDEFFMYNEDQNYCWRGLVMGYKHFLSVKGMVWHKYKFSKNKNKWYHSEKNRLMMIGENYQKKTIILLLPIIFVNEILLLIYALIDGWFRLKIKSYMYLIRNIKLIRYKRNLIQKTRLVLDKEIIGRFSCGLNFAEIDSLIIKKFVNPTYRQYYKFINNFL